MSDQSDQNVLLHVILLHDDMINKQGEKVTTSLTMIDTHDLARSSRTYDVTKFYVSHSSPTLRRLAKTLKFHWEEGYGATYNPKRKAALERVRIVSSLDEAISDIEASTGKLPKLIATSAARGEGRYSYSEMRKLIEKDDQPFLLMFGTGWGMCDELLARADYYLEPIEGPVLYNHLSVRSAAAIILDRLRGK
jgi:hypothetical protein